MLTIIVHISEELVRRLDQRYALLEFADETTVHTAGHIADECMHAIVQAAQAGRHEVTLAIRGEQ